jgi:outer membrane immunogenic protein
MRKIVLSMGLLFMVVLASAQNPLPKGKAQLNAGLGFSSWGIPIYVGFDYGVHKDITIGGELNFHSYHENYKGANYNHTVLGILFDANYHFNTILQIPNNWDFYAGLNIGFNFWSSPDNYPGPYSSGLGLGAQIGGRYFFNNKFGINLELGGGNASTGGKIGITYKF